ncbi:hypothetical protein [Leptothoe kymatousa]|uniref:hypothetical protein n=1 Tax=Leptothoe kymatousa TaxID=2651727 RepID=UPI001C030D85|nr:hypothetical protein [Leptothoe kymatousa]
MNSESENLKRLLLEFLTFDRSASPPSGSKSTTLTESNPSAVCASEVGSDAVSFDTLFETGQSFHFGDKTTVQDRFHTLLKHRFQTEFANRPPLFPWEAEVREYPAEVPAYAQSMSRMWLENPLQFSVSSKLPETVLHRLLDRCQNMVQSTQKQGVKLVQIVESLFPDSLDALEPIANIVLTPAYRSGSALAEATLQEVENLAGGFDQATPEQQIALTMLASMEIMSALALTVSAEESTVGRDWVTSEGVVHVDVNYSGAVLIINATLPTGGSIQLVGADSDSQSSRPEAGMLTLAQTAPVIGASYSLEVSLDNDGQRPLRFSLMVLDPSVS